MRFQFPEFFKYPILSTLLFTSTSSYLLLMRSGQISGHVAAAVNLFFTLLVSPILASELTPAILPMPYLSVPALPLLGLLLIISYFSLLLLILVFPCFWILLHELFFFTLPLSTS